MATSIMRAKWDDLKKYEGDIQLWECLRAILDATKRKFDDKVVTECLIALKKE